MHVHSQSRPHAAGFSLVEALMALSITALAGAVLLLSVESSLNTTGEAVERSIADGIAQQVLNEILTKRYVEPGENGGGTGGSNLGPTAWEQSGSGRERFNDVDDYAGYIAQPLTGVYGESLGIGDGQGGLRPANFRLGGDFFQDWRLRVDVYYVHPHDHTMPTSGATAYRAVEVTVERIDADGRVRPLASRKRIVSYVPPRAN